MSRISELQNRKVLTFREFTELVQTLGSNANITKEGDDKYIVVGPDGLTTKLIVVEDSIDASSLASPKYSVLPTIVNFVHDLKVLQGTTEATLTLLDTPTVTVVDGTVEVTGNKIKIKFTADSKSVAFKLKNDVGEKSFKINLVWIDTNGNPVGSTNTQPDPEDEDLPDDSSITTSVPASIALKLDEDKEVELTNYTDQELHLFYNSKRKQSHDLLKQGDNKVESGKLKLRLPSDSWVGSYLFVAKKDGKEKTQQVTITKEA